jgi:predicted dehydrogenase
LHAQLCLLSLLVSLLHSSFLRHCSLGAVSDNLCTSPNESLRGEFLSSKDLIAVAVVGAGAFGRNHARVYHQLQQEGAPVRLLGIVDTDLARADDVAREFNCRPFGSVDQLLSTHSELRAASVAVPTSHHVATAKALMQASVDVLIEKPLASSLREADELVEAAHSTNAIAQVGHLERFNPAVQAAMPLINRPMFFEVHRLSVFTPRSLDVDVVLDLMIHDLDAVLSLVNSPVKEVRAAGLPILSNKIDIANARIEFESGCVANFTASRVSTERIRKLRFFQPRQYISIDYSRQDVLVFTVGGNEGSPSANPEIKMSKPAIIPEEPLKAEIRAFLDSVRTRTPPAVSLEEGRRALSLALEVLAQIEVHARKLNLGG